MLFAMKSTRLPPRLSTSLIRNTVGVQDREKTLIFNYVDRNSNGGKTLLLHIAVKIRVVFPNLN